VNCLKNLYLCIVKQSSSSNFVDAESCELLKKFVSLHRQTVRFKKKDEKQQLAKEIRKQKICLKNVKSRRFGRDFAFQNISNC